MEWLIGLPMLAAIIGAIYSFITGCRAIKRGLRHDNDRAWASHLLGINLCEPLINMTLISASVWIFIVNGTNGVLIFLEFIPEDVFRFIGPVLVTAPMSMLLTAVYGLFLSDPACRRLCLKLLMLGTARWALTASVFMSAFAFESVEWAVIPFLVGTAVLWACAIWGHRQLISSPITSSTVTALATA